MKNDEISNLYNIRFPEDKKLIKYKIWKVLCKYYFQKLIPHDSVLVDIGCGYGEFINHINAKIKYAVDINSESKLYLNNTVNFINQSATNFKLDEEIDIFFSSNFFEHLESKDQIDDILRYAYNNLKKGGKYIIMQPNIRIEPGRYWDYYDHKIPLTELSMEEALLSAGFKIEFKLAKFLPFTSTGNISTHPLLVWLYLKTPIVWKLMGGQFLIVAYK
jgi:SAM-dependent methyltransferase